MVYSYQDLTIAWNKVKENRGCAGADCVTIEDFEKDLDGNLILLHSSSVKPTNIP